MGRIASFIVVVWAALTATLANADPQTSARMQLLFIGADPADGAPGPLPADMPILQMAALPTADAVTNEVFGALLRSNPVSTFVTTPGAGEAQFEQFFLVSDITLDTGEGGLQIGTSGDMHDAAEFSRRLSALVDAFNPEHRRVAFLRVQDPKQLFPVSMAELQDAVGASGFDLLAVMIYDDDGAGACAQDVTRAIHYPIVTGVADRAPFGNDDAISSVAEVNDFLGAALHRMSARGNACGPKYSVILKSGDDDTAALINHTDLPGFAELETQLYHETFEALFLLESDDQAELQAFLDTCVYCPNEGALADRRAYMRQVELARKLEEEVWAQISADTSQRRLRIYLSNCTLCTFKEEAEAQIAHMDAVEAAFEQEATQFAAAASERDLVALRAYVDDCVACAEVENARTLISDLENDAVYQAELKALQAAKVSGNVEVMKAYLTDCVLCDARGEIEDLIARETRRVAASAPCFAAAGLPQSGGPRKLEAIDQSAARQVCNRALADFPDDPALKTMIGRIDHAAGDVVRARNAYSKGVEAAVPAAYGLLAYTHYAPEAGGEADLETAERLATAGADLGDWLSQELLTVLYSKNLIPGKDAGDAFTLASALAGEGNALAQFFVGYFYLTGSGVDADETNAVTWLGQAVEQGYLHAFSFLAELHEQGRGTELSPDRAADLYWAAFLRSDPTAKERLTTQLSSRHPDVVRSVQQRLRTEGVYRGQIDGIAGPSTVSAVQTFSDTLTENG
ncbi:hypothetical protein JANAI62_08080 [Jannaschia pagri]|uniref:Peptidoglycan binding-like domain-containing protein n=1 Tax=Jannaschia pagri TaxID=2829797 RepID=A0ABQ4NIY5_9RHOB|nr:MULTISPECIES: SEL1-like repeat protein [unclassified Jannaschia]GIT89707.1 hypothetical protein JANAI61_01650 [Jannaschia sp. AI_61]GIT94185.1 hypothetical protein JANAI62_08080 [Jannaschia sp. AI_62]